MLGSPLACSDLLRSSDVELHSVMCTRQIH